MGVRMNGYDIILQLPSEEHKEMANEFKQEFFENNETIINGSALLDQMDYDLWLGYTRKNQNTETVSEDWVVSDTFFAMRESDGKIIGMIDIRHNIEHEFLKNYCGHIGYAVCPSERRKGYATQMLRLALEHAKSLEIKKVMLGCYADNEASIKTIVKCGGVLAESKQYLDSRLINIYWIEL